MIHDGTRPGAMLVPHTSGAAEPLHLWNPVEFDPSDHLSEGSRRYSDCGRYILDRIHHAHVVRRRERDEFVPLNASILRRRFPNDRAYKLTMDDLIGSGAMVCDNQYIKGEKSLGYRLGSGLAGMRHRKFAVTDLVLARKLWADRRDRIRAPEGHHRHLLHYLRALEIDFPAALDFLLRQKDFNPSDETAIQMIRDGEFFFHVCEYGRVHTNLTSLNSDLRGFLTYRGMPLVNLDIRNSQPLIFSLLLRRRYGARDAMPADVRLYMELCEAGKFYDHLMAESGIPPEKRDEFKKKFFGHVFFCGNRYETEAAKLFGKAFPNVYSLIRQLKKEDYTALSKDLQRVESDLIIAGVARRCMEEFPGGFVATIHDSVVTTADRAEAIRCVMLEEFAKVGLRPTIRVEDLSRPDSSYNCPRFTS